MADLCKTTKDSIPIYNYTGNIIDIRYRKLLDFLFIFMVVKAVHATRKTFKTDKDEMTNVLIS